MILALNRLVRKLDKRRSRQSQVGRFTSKERVLSDPSDLGPPENYPEWAVQL